MTDIRVKIKDKQQFQMVFPQPLTDSAGVGRFIRSIIGQYIYVKQVPSSRCRSRNVFITEEDWVIMPDWIAWFDTNKLVPSAGLEDCGLALFVDCVLIVMSV